ncbi:Mce protein [Mycolicibacterium hippocampi]|uniref:MCE associated membrane protein n=1 Tax=Mycolicibacterium hippocampi TaxID=659824 RepID=A0A850PH27_9MYCO|nr:Mce protein [Mycolicibacterium hippocampi]NVN49689.1 MCE associated membrane protein [Mycolicibacterium hippocampi]
MAVDDAAPDGELSKQTSEPNHEAGVEESGAVEPESTAVEESAAEVTAADEIDAGESDARDEAEGTDVEDTEAGDTEAEDYEAEAPVRTPISHVKLALIGGLAGVLALAGLTGWLGFRAYESNKAAAESALFLQVGRQGALNLTSIDFENAEADVQRILDSATGTFYDDFQQRAQPFVEVVKQAQSKSVGTIAEAGIESESDNEAQVLVAVTVRTSNAGAPEQEPRAWRMRILVEKIGDEAKVSNVEFVP